MSETILPETWIYAQLGNVAKIVGGGTPSRDDKSLFGGEIPWVTPTDMTQIKGLWISKTHETITEKGLLTSSAKLLPVGTVLMTSRATIGTTAIAMQQVSTNQGFANFICNEQWLFNEYLAYWLPSIKDWLIQIAGGTTFKEISKSTLATIEIPLPPLPEQRRIVAILQQADRLRQLRREADEKAQGLLQALFYEMFGDPTTNPRGWDAAKVDDICNLVRGSSPRPQGDSRYFGGTLPRLMVADITRDGLYVTPKIDSLTEEGAKASRLMKAGSVVMTASGAPGLPAILTVDAYIHDGFVGFRNLSEKLDPNFFLGFLLAMRNKNSTQAVGATFLNLNTDQIKNWPILIPPPQLQKEYVSLSKEIREAISKQLQASQHLESLFQSLLAQAFSGELTVVWREKHNDDVSTVSSQLSLESFDPDDDELEEAPASLSAADILKLFPDALEIGLVQSATNYLQDTLTFLEKVTTRQDVFIEISPEQLKLLRSIFKVHGYFTIETIQAESKLLQYTVRDGLQLFSELGIIQKIALPDRPVRDIVYTSAYRTLIEATDEVRQSDRIQLEEMLEEMQY